MDPITFAQVRTLFECHGELRSQPASDWTGDAMMPLPAPVAGFYAEVGPWGSTMHASVGPVGIMLFGLAVSIPPLKRLANAQLGHRIIGTPPDLRRNPDWPDDWLVVANEPDAAFVLDCTNQQVLHKLHGAPAQVFAPDLPTAMAALATLSSAYLALDIADDGSETEDWVDEEPSALALAKIQTALAQLVSEPEAQRMMAVLDLR